MGKYIFIFSFFFAIAVQFTVWNSDYVFDRDWWAYEGKYVLENDPQQFDASKAYGHPGGPVILGAIAANKIFDMPYKTHTMVWVMTIFNSFILAGIALLAYKLRDGPWWLAGLLILSTHRLNFQATPPSSLSSMLIVFLMLLTLYLTEHKKEVKLPLIFFWSCIAGLSIATRFDIGSLMTFVFFLLLIKPLGLKKALLAGTTSLYFFALFDPFMWFMPVQHLKDLFYKIFYHYEQYPFSSLPLDKIIDIGFLTGVGVISFIVLYVARKEHRLSVPPYFGWALVFVTVLLYGVFLTANYKAPRYFMPTSFMWELLLSLFLFDASKDKLNSAFTPQVGLVILVLANIGFFLAFVLL